MPASTLISSRVSRIDELPLSQGAVIIPLLAGFVTPSTPSWAFIFYLTAIPPVLLTLLRGWRPDWRNPALIAMLSLWGWSALTIAWNHHFYGHGKTQAFWIVNALWTLVLIVNFVSAAEAEPRTRDRAMQAMIYGAAMNATISLILFVLKGQLATRLWGWGISGNPVMGAAIIDICLLLALGRAEADPRQRIPMAAASLPMAAFLALSYSRAALLALAAAALLIFLGRRPVIAILTSLVIAAAGVLLWKFGAVLFPTLWDNLASRGDDCHSLLWRTAWHAIRANPIIGYGPSATLPNLGAAYCPPFPSPHDLYLSLLFYSGAVGLALFIIAVALLWRHLRAVTTGFTRRLWLAVGLVPLVVGITDLVQVDKGPSPMWYILWLPMLLVLTLPGIAATPKLQATRALLPPRARR